MINNHTGQHPALDTITRITTDIERLTRTFCVMAPRRRRLRRPSLDTAVIAEWLTQPEWT